MNESVNKELAFYNKEKKNWFVDWLLGRPYVFMSRYIYHLRCIERYNRRDLRYLWHYFFYRRLSYKLGFQIPPHTIGGG